MGGKTFGRVAAGLATGGLSEGVRAVSKNVGGDGFGQILSMVDPTGITSGLASSFLGGDKPESAAGNEKPPTPEQLSKSPNSSLTSALQRRSGGTGKGRRKGLTLFSGSGFGDDIFNIGLKNILGG